MKIGKTGATFSKNGVRVVGVRDWAASIFSVVSIAFRRGRLGVSSLSELLAQQRHCTIRSIEHFPVVPTAVDDRKFCSPPLQT